MNNRRSYLDSINAGRQRRATTSLEELSSTLEELESRISRNADDRWEPRRPRPQVRRPIDDGYYSDRRDAEPSRSRRAPMRDAQDDRYPPVRQSAARDATDEIHALRHDLHQQLSVGLRREFSQIKGEIEQALRTAAPASQVAELGVELERLVSLIHKLSQRTDDRQINMLRLEMEEVKTALTKLAREDTVQSFDRRWDELERRWSDLAQQLSQAGTSDYNESALNAFGARLEQINAAVNALPDSVTLHGLQEEMRALAATVDRVANRHDRVGPDTLASIEDRLDEITRAVAHSSTPAPAPALDTAPLERLEARITLLARQLGKVVEDHPATGLAEQFSMLSNRVEDIAHKIDLPGEMIERLGAQVDMISRKLDSTSQLPQIDDVFRNVEDRFISLSELLEQRHEDALLQGQSLFRDLEHRLDQVTSRIAESDDRAPASKSQLLEAIDLRFADLAARMEQQQAFKPAFADDHGIVKLEARLDQISMRLDSSEAAPAVDPDLIRSLESQIAGLAAHIKQPAAPVADAEARLLPRLDQLEQSISQGRQDVIQAAREAAEDAVRAFAGTSGNDTLALDLVGDLRALEALTRKSDDRNAKTFEAIHDTLLKIVERLGTVEAGIHRQPSEVRAHENRREPRLGLQETPSLSAMPDASWLQEPFSGGEQVSAEREVTSAADVKVAAAPADRGAGRLSMLGGLSRALGGRNSRQAKTVSAEPSVTADRIDDKQDTLRTIPDVSLSLDAELDPQIANRPLEPGSGAPDLNAIMKRVRDERNQTSDSPGAEAAKADFIAAARRAAQAAAAEAEVMKRAPAEKEKPGGIAKIFKNRKTVLMGVAAVLMALAAMQYGNFRAGNNEVASAEEPAAVAVAEVEAPTIIVEDVQEQVVRSATQNVAGTPLMAIATESTADASTDWLSAEVVTSNPASLQVAPQEVTAVPDNAEEVASLPAPTESDLVDVPAEAGPVILREAAAEGDAKALFEIGNRYAEGRGVSEDLAKAAVWYGMAAEQGLAPAQYRLGNMYEKGIGVERDTAQAKAWYERAALQGNASAMHNLAVLHAMGADADADNVSAVKWFAQAAELGIKDSQFNLGILSARGVGIPQNLEEAYKWFALLAKAGDRDAGEKRDEVAKAMQPAALESAQAAVELWRVKPLDPEANNVEIPESWSEDRSTTASIDMNQAVRNIQHILTKNGYDAGGVDGQMGQKTKAAIAAFQKDNGMPETGEVNEALVRALLDRR
jgi:localization factor PodJL